MLIDQRLRTERVKLAAQQRRQHRYTALGALVGVGALCYGWWGVVPAILALYAIWQTVLSG